MYLDQNLYIRQYLMNARVADFLKAKPDQAFQDDLNAFEGYFANVEARAQAAGVPLVVTVLPQRAQAAMISQRTWPDGFDPYALGNEIRSIVERHGGTYIDVLHAFKNIPHPEQDFYPVDGHPNDRGQELFATVLSKALTSGVVPSLAKRPVPSSKP